MSVALGEFYSEALGMNTKFVAILPEESVVRQYPAGHKFKTLYMLHGGLGTAFGNVSATSIATDIKAIFPDLVVIMPSAQFSFYTDYVKEYQYAYKYRTYIADELVEMTRSLFPLSDRREDTAVYGCSMGGFGAYGAALNNPETFGYTGAQSGMVDIGWAVETREWLKIKHQRMFGEQMQIEGTEHDYYTLATNLANSSGPKPLIYHSWGEKDYLLEINEKFYEHMKGLDLDYSAYRIPGYHSWGIDSKNGVGIRIFLKWLKENMTGVKDTSKTGDELIQGYSNDFADYKPL